MMDARSEAFFPFVHPDLVKVLRATPQVPAPFVVVYGLRTLAAEKQAVASGHSTTLHSRHLPNKDGLSCAVDVAALEDGKVSFAVGREAQVFGAIAAQIKATAASLGIPVEWGGDPIGAWAPGAVNHFFDFGHIQLPWLQYP